MLTRIKFKFPSFEQVQEANRIYTKAYNSLKEDGVMSKNLMMTYLRNHGLFTKELQDEMDMIEGSDLFKYPKLQDFETKEEEDLYTETCLLEISSGERIIDVEDLLKNEKESDKEYNKYVEIAGLKSKLLKYSRESLATDIKNVYLVHACTYNADTDKRIWDTYQDILEFKNKSILVVIASRLFSFLSGLNQTIIRKISRHSVWRTKWISATKTGCAIFDESIYRWDINKIYLCYWSNFLDNIYSGYEQPEDFIVKDDKMLDAWIEAKQREVKSGNTAGSSKGAGGDTDRALFKPRINPAKKR